VVAIGGPTDAVIGNAIEAAAPGRAHSACGQVGPRTSTALIARDAALVTNDSSPLHLALATRTPMVALFGPTVPSFGFGPLGPDAICLGVEELLCRPCATYGPAACPLDHHRCLRQLSVERVAAALAKVRQRAGARR
jgi:heptosyltransferase-2